MGPIATGVALGACLVMLAGTVVLDRRPYRPGKPNYTLVMIVALALSLVFARHLFALLV